MVLQLQDYNFWFYTLSAIPQTLAAMFALVIAVLVFRTGELNRVINRDVEDSKRFLLPIFKNLEIHEIEAMTGKEYLGKLETAVEHILKKDAQNLGIEKDDYERLKKLYQTKIEEYERYYSPDENRIFNYLLVKKDSIRTHILSRNLVEICFFVLIILTTLIIFFSLYYLPQSSLDLICKFKVIHILALLNTLAIAAGVLIMVFTLSLELNFSFKAFVKSSTEIIFFPSISVIIWPFPNPCSNAVEFASTEVIKTPCWNNDIESPNIDRMENNTIIINTQILHVNLIFICLHPFSNTI